MAFKIKEIFLILTLAVVSAVLFNSFSASGVSYTYTKPVYKENTVLSLYETKLAFDKKEARFIDARPQSQFRRGHIPTALNVPYNSAQIDQLMAAITHDESLIVYCYSKHCNQAKRLARALKNLGYTNIALFEEGMKMWFQSRYPIATPGLSHE